MIALKDCAWCGTAFRGQTAKSRYCSPPCAWKARKGQSLDKNRLHGQSHTPTYVSWRDMKIRCLNPERKDYARYGGRGIAVCERWMSFANFFADMGEKPGRGYTIERNDSNGNYEPSNCRWATKLEQARNKSNTYTAEQDQKIREAIALGLSFRQMSEYVGKSQSSVMGRTYYMGLKSGRPPTRTDYNSIRRDAA